MAFFRVSLDGIPLGMYECSGKYDVANELFGKMVPSPEAMCCRFANVAVYREDETAFGVVLLDEGNKKLLAEHL
jgi:hypothetical protein